MAVLDNGSGLRRLARALGLGSALGIGVAAGCLGDLPGGRSCGDGWWDPNHEECDPSSEDRSYAEACREQGFGDRDAECDPSTCELRASEELCSRCGDGIASGDEDCDGNDLRGATCPAGSGLVLCTDECTLDFSSCPQVCGDGIITGTEECEPSLSCGDDTDCGPGRQCYGLLSECVPSQGFGPDLSCSFYNTTAVGINKPYASGTITSCIDGCQFGRNDCGFCGDGERDDKFIDFVYPSGDPVEFPAEFCDGKEALRADIITHCEPLCTDDPINSDVVVLCEPECNADCSAFAPPEDVIPDPEALRCCLEKGSPCPKFGTEGVPDDLPCCSWLDNPAWAEEQKCVVKDTQQLPVTFICP